VSGILECVCGCCVVVFALEGRIYVMYRTNLFIVIVIA
jgi:hypothetical protein